ncbi:NUDIX domain-containing protein [Thalassovita sp.]|uniref:NUDIX domain-containing protein n=1 Tax=Thalassovita sp. TaxID=1979401 RepID=UPI002881A64E|nr:NUDIX domain-containing protein [Thalassovita sp.]MDF1804580.1 NUDIX domain-containing protein [Thalassovita sp.]
MKNLFFYGTLRHQALLELVLGRPDPCKLSPAVLSDYCTYQVKDEGFPVLIAEGGAQSTGLLAEGLSDEDIARLVFYEGGFGYDLHLVSVQTDIGPRDAEVWLTTPGRFQTDGLFDLEHWETHRAAIKMRAAEDVMRLYGHKTAQEVALLYPMIEMRASSYILGQVELVPDALGGLTRDDVVSIQKTQPYVSYFAVESHRLQFRQFDGSMGAEVEYASFAATDAALVLPYDPVRDRVMMVEQFRMGPYVRGDRVPWQLEPIAGRVDAAETPDQTAMREAYEEAGLELDELKLVSRGYPSPGCSNEYFHTYVGLVDLPDGSAGVGGLETENENIRSHVMTFDAAMEMFERGELRVLPLVAALLWLARHRDRLRAGA